MSDETGTEVVSAGSGAYGPCAREETLETGETPETRRVVCLLDPGSPYEDKTFTPVGERGYRRMTERGHPVAQKSGKVLVHRAVLYDALLGEFGDGPYTCHWCGWSDLDWFVDRADPAYLTVDHLDGNSANNRRSNILATHKWCNDNRYVIESKGLSWDTFKSTPPGKRPALRNTRTGAPTEVAYELARDGSAKPPEAKPDAGLSSARSPASGAPLPIRKGLVRWEDLVG